jgi:hypothetical protein
MTLPLDIDVEWNTNIKAKISLLLKSLHVVKLEWFLLHLRSFDLYGTADVENITYS